MVLKRPLSNGSASGVESTTTSTITTGHYATNAEDGARLHYAAGGSGPLVVMAHGFPDYHGSWLSQMNALASDYRVAALDMRGFNLSDAPEGVEAYKLSLLTTDIVAIIKAEGYESATVIGHDWGGATAWRFAFHHPEMLDRLVILSTPHPAAFAAEIANNPDQAKRSQYALKFQKPDSEKALSPNMLANIVAPEDADKRAEYEEVFGRSNFSAMMNYYRANFQSGPPREGATPLPKVSAPTLVIHGMDDIALASSGHNNTWERISADTSMLMIPGAGHWVHHDQEQLVNGTIKNWLDLRAKGA